MAKQFSLPISSPFQLGTWESSPFQVFGNLWLNIDEPPAGTHDSATTFIAATPPTGQLLNIQFAPLLEPAIIATGVKFHVVHFRVEPINFEVATLQVFQGDPSGPTSRFIAQLNYNPSTAWIDQFQELSGAAAAQITDWGDIWCRLQIFSGSATGSMRITQVYIEAGEPKIGAAPVQAVELKLEPQDVATLFAPRMVIIEDPVELPLAAKDVEVVFGPKVITAGDFDVEVTVPDVNRIFGPLTIKPDPVNVEIRLEDTPVKVNRTIHPDTIVVEVSTPPTRIDATITPAAVPIEITLPAVTVGTAFKPTPVLVEVEVQGPTVILGPLVLTPDAIVVAVSPIAVDTTITPLIIAPDPVDVFVSVPVFATTKSPKVLTPDDNDVEVDVPAVTVLFGPRTLLPTAIPVVIKVEMVSRAAVLLMPDVIIVEIFLPDLEVVHQPFRVPRIETPRRPGRRFRPTYTPSVIRFPGPFRGRYRHDARGLYRVFNTFEYRFYFRDGVPPDELDTPYATSATLAATPATIFADGDWYLSVSLFNGVIDSGFLPLGANGESYQKLRVSGSVAAGEAPHGPGDWRLERRAGGVVSVIGFYYDASPIRAAEWAIGFTTDGSGPPEDSPTLTVTMPTVGLAVLDNPLPAQADGTVVKVRLQTRRTGPNIYSERSTIKQAVAAAAAAAATVGTLDRWTGRLPVDRRP